MSEEARILVVDDDDAIRALLRELLETSGYRVTVAREAGEARRRLVESHFDVALCDVRMPGESGLSLARHIAAEYPYTAPLIVTSFDDARTVAAALDDGVYGYVVKPFRSSELLYNVASALRRLRSQTLAAREREMLEHRLEQTGAELAATLREVEQRRGPSHEVETMRRLAKAIEHRCRETADHIERVGAHCAVIAEGVGLDPHQRERIRIASSLHDIGKVAVPDRILLKPGRLTAEERREVERHAEIGRDVLAASEGELMALAASIAWTHHERFDGSGYPRGLAGEEIPLEGRIVAVADVFDALTHDRVYRRALSAEESIAVMGAGRGARFDPGLLDAFLGSLAAAPAG